MPTVAMPDGTTVEMPDKVDAATQSRLKAVLDKQRGNRPSSSMPSYGKGATGSWNEPNEGLDFADKTGLAAMTTTHEKRNFLEKKYGKDNVSLEWGDKGNEPRMFVRKNGKQIEVSDDMGFLPNLAAAGPEIAGMMALGPAGAEIGATLGAPLGPAGVAIGGVGGALVGSGVGAVGGFLAREAGKSAVGLQGKNAAQLKEQVKGEFTSGVIAEGTGQIVGKALRGGLPRKITGVTDESRDLFMRAKEGGAMPHWLSSGEDLKKLQRVEVDAAKVSGKAAKQFEANRKYVLSEVADVLKKGGMPPQYIQSVLDEIHNPTSAFSGKEVGEMVQKALQHHVEMLEQHVTQATKDANSVIDPLIATIKGAPSKPGALAMKVAKASKEAYDTFKNKASELYTSLHKATGGAAIVPMQPIRDAANGVLASLPKSVHSALVKELGKPAEQMTEYEIEQALTAKLFHIEMPKEDHITLEQAQNIRSILREKGAASIEGARSISQGQHLHLANSVDSAIDQAAEAPEAAAFVKQFRDVNTWYKDTRAKFYDASIEKLRGMMNTDTPPEPHQVVQIIRESGKSSVVAHVREMTSPAVWKRVQAEDLRMTLAKVSTIDATGARTIDGMKLLDLMSNDKASTLTRAIHNPFTVPQLKLLGNILAAKGGKLDPEVLKAGTIKDAITNIRAQEKALGEYVDKDLLAAFRDPKTPPEDVYQAVIGKESRTEAAFKLLGNDPAKIQGLRQAALEQLARRSEMSAMVDYGKNAMGEALKQFTPRQQELLFPKGLVGDIQKLDKIIRFIYPGLKEGTMASMHAGSVLEKPIRERLYIQAVKASTRWLVIRPTFMQYVLHGFPDRAEHRIIKAILQGSTLAEDQPETIQDEPPPNRRRR